MIFGSEAVMLFDTPVYPQLKKFFDVVQEGDAHTIALKAQATASAAGQE